MTVTAQLSFMVTPWLSRGKGRGWEEIKSLRLEDDFYSKLIEEKSTSASGRGGERLEKNAAQEVWALISHSLVPVHSHRFQATPPPLQTRNGLALSFWGAGCQG